MSRSLLDFVERVLGIFPLQQRQDEWWKKNSLGETKKIHDLVERESQCPFGAIGSERALLRRLSCFGDSGGKALNSSSRSESESKTYQEAEPSMLPTPWNKLFAPERPEMGSSLEVGSSSLSSSPPAVSSVALSAQFRGGSEASGGFSSSAEQSRTRTTSVGSAYRLSSSAESNWSSGFNSGTGPVSPVKYADTIDHALSNLHLDSIDHAPHLYESATSSSTATDGRGKTGWSPLQHCWSADLQLSHQPHQYDGGMDNFGWQESPNPFRQQKTEAPVSVLQAPPSFSAAGANVNVGTVGPSGRELLHDPAVEGPPEPVIRIFPQRMMNFTNFCVRFMIQAIDFPPEVYLEADMMEVIVQSPSGQLIQGYVSEGRNADDGRVMSFMGTFKSTGEVGQYHLIVRVSLPYCMWSVGKYGVIGEEMTINVCRNYFKESQAPPVASFQLDYVPWKPKPSMKMTVQEKPSVMMTLEEKPYYHCKAWGIACDVSSNLIYSTDRTGHSLACTDPNGEIVFKYPREPMDEELNRPCGICVDVVNRRLIVADKDNHRICFFSLDGKYISSFGGPGHGNGEFGYPWDVDVSPDGNRIAVTDSRNKRVQMFNRNGEYISKFSVFETNPFEFKNNFDYPRGVSFNTTGTSIYVTDFNANNIPSDMSTFKKVVPEGRLCRPQGIAVDSENCVLVCDSRNTSVCHVDVSSGQVLSHIRTLGSEKLDYPVNVAAMGGGYIAVLDSQGKVRIF